MGGGGGGGKGGKLFRLFWVCVVVFCLFCLGFLFLFLFVISVVGCILYYHSMQPLPFQEPTLRFCECYIFMYRSSGHIPFPS